MKSYAVLQGECCIEKIVFQSINQGIKLVASMREDQ